MIPTPDGWLRSERGEVIYLRSSAEHPVGEIRCREMIGPPRSARVIVAEQLASPLPAPLSSFTALMIGAPERMTTDEGEHAAVIKIDGRLGAVPLARVIGLVFGDHTTVVLDGIAIQPRYFEELDHTVRECVRGAALMLGVRRRRYVYAMPPGWQAFARRMVTSFIPPDHPRNAEHISVFPAVPRGPSWQHLVQSTHHEQIGRVEAIEILDESPVRSLLGLAGRRWRLRSRTAAGSTRNHQVVVFEDHRYAYPLRFDEEPRTPASDVFDALCASVEPLGTRLTEEVTVTRRERLAVFGGFSRAPELAAREAFAHVQAIARGDRFREIDVIGDDRPARMAAATGVRVRASTALAHGDAYHVLYAAYGELTVSAPHVLRAATDRAPVVCELATVHHKAPWIHLLVAGLSGALRATDAFIFPSAAIEALYLRVWERWRTRFDGFPAPRTAVIPSAIHGDTHHRDDARRTAARRELGVADADVVFATRRAAKWTDEEHASLIASWGAIVARAPRAVLAIAMDAPPHIADELRGIARGAGVGDRVIVVSRVHGLWSDPTVVVRAAADVWLHAGTAVEECAPSIVLAAMAHELPVIATRVPGIAELVRDETGILVDVRTTAVADSLRGAAFGRHGSVAAREVIRHAAADPQQLANAIVALTEDPERRIRSGHGALRAVREHHELADVTARRLEFFDEVSARAEAEWIGPRPVAPLVDLDEVMGHQASHRLDPTTRIAAACADALALIPDARDDDATSNAFRALAEQTVEQLSGGSRTLAEIAACDDESALAACLARLIAYHVVEIERAPATKRSGTAAPIVRARAPRTGRDRLALLGGFLQSDEAAPHGTNHAAFAYSVGVAQTHRYSTIDAMYDRDPRGQLQPLPDVAIQQRDLDELPASTELYDVVYVAHGDQLRYSPHLLRPRADWAPVVCEVGTTHHPQQWLNLLLAAASGAVRATDGVIYASEAARQIHEQVWTRWRTRLGSIAIPRSTVIANAVDAAEHQRDEVLRASTRRDLGLADDDVAILSFGRLSPHTKGDQLALVTLWREVHARAPRASLILAGAVADPGHAEHLRRQAREAGVGGRVIIVEDPYARWPRARTALMSAADALIHVSTGLEETASLVILEAMAHGLPVIASRWAGASQTLRDGEEGALIDVCAAPLPHALSAAVFGRVAHAHAGEVSRYAACDARQLIAAVVKLVDEPDHRRRCGETALRSVRERHSLADAMRRRVEFFDELAEQAQSTWTGSIEPERPLIDLDEVIAWLGQVTA